MDRYHQLAGLRRRSRTARPKTGVAENGRRTARLRTVCATGLICLVIALLFGWNFIAALIWGCLTGAVQAGAIRLIHGEQIDFDPQAPVAHEEARFSAGFFTPMMADHLTQKAPPSP
ncbi:hypothetical protein LRP31_10080 [Mesorhizobium mediterraneum]|uniref:hypothetical protein n=1 Tax=Mesorhizobium mediterraneum TaxID=43617 RepID=UPI000FE5A630|nr:hypothetical protein [Mesorhizobium mediterraneum]RWN28907.1 MAG: hypothetical protein EOR96_32135 [Mesorhizobium sp.]WIW55516.1 hypothetical protein LRP31_10080 [Mesorhizobium mediterraneum]